MKQRLIATLLFSTVLALPAAAAEPEKKENGGTDLFIGKDLKGFIGLQVQGIGKKQGPCEVAWRNLKIRDLK